MISPYDTLQCTPVYYVRDAQGRPVLGGTFKNWDQNVNQPMDLMTAIEASCDTYFYQLGYSFYKLPPDRGHPLQAWAARLGIGKRDRHRHPRRGGRAASHAGVAEAHVHAEDRPVLLAGRPLVEAR